MSLRSVEEIQAELGSLGETLATMVRQLRLVEIMTALEKSYPDDLDLEQVGEGEICPPLAWEINTDVGNAKILLEEAIESLKRASGRAEQDVRREWLEEKLSQVKDPSTHAILRFLFFCWSVTATLMVQPEIDG